MSAAELAILQLAQARAAVAASSRRIGEALEACNAKQEKGNPDGVFADHLKDAYAMTSDENEDGGSSERYFINHDGDAGAYLSGVCPNCRAAHDAIQDRKAARKQHGIAKRRVALMGTWMLKNKATGETS